MKNKMTIVLMLVMVLGLAGMAQAYTLSWCFTSGNWADAARWDAVKPLPTLDGQAIVYNGATLDVTTAGQGAWDAAIGYEPSVNPGVGVTVNVAAGIEFTINNSLMVGNGNTGTLNIYGTVLSKGIRVTTGASGDLPGLRGTVNVYSGGLLKVGDGGWAITVGEGTAGGSINLKGTGSMEVGGDGAFHMNLNSGRGHIDIEAGQLKVLGNHQTALQTFVNNGWITSRGGSSEHCSLVVSYLDGYTYVKTTGCTCTTNLQADLNKDCYVDMSDLAFLAQNWLNCTVSTDPDCVQ